MQTPLESPERNLFTELFQLMTSYPQAGCGQKVQLFDISAERNKQEKKVIHIVHSPY